MLAVLPILLLFISGYIFNVFTKKDLSEGLIDVVLYFIFPVFIIYKIHFLAFNEAILHIIFLGCCAFVIGIVLALTVGKLLGFDKKTIASIMIVTAFGNTSFLGFAFIDAYYGTHAVSLAIFYDQIAVMLLLSIFSPLIFNYAHSMKFDYSKVVKSVVTFPPFIGLVIALVTKPIPFPSVLVAFLEQVSVTLLPLVVFAVGMKFEFTLISGKFKEMTLGLVIKMIFIPFFVYMIALLFFEIDLAIKTAIIEAAMPPMVLASVLSIRAGLDRVIILSALGVGMLLSFILIPMWVSIIH